MTQMEERQNRPNPYAVCDDDDESMPLTPCWCFES